MRNKNTDSGNDKSAMMTLLFGIVLFVVALIVTSIQHQQKMDLIATFTTSSPGIVERVEPYKVRRNKRRITKYKYFVSFEDSDGIRHEGESMARSEKKQIHSEGDAVTVRYDPMRADEACVIEGDEDLV